VNSPFFQTATPADAQSARERIFAGGVTLRPGGPAAHALVDRVTRLARERLETHDIRTAHSRWTEEEFFARIGAIRRAVYTDRDFHGLLVAVVAECGFDVGRIAFDPARLRVVQPGGHRNPRAAPVYYPHRDTWYAHPQCMIVWWLPLHDLSTAETFEFYPDHFGTPVANDSEVFDYDDWVKDGPTLKIGWQQRDSGLTARYPGALETTLPERAERFSCRAADTLVFSGAHYHRTLPHNRPLTRYSLDFRVVDLDDVAAGRGAPNVDNRSRGATLKDYVRA
jgi:hypothetical protein